MKNKYAALFYFLSMVFSAFNVNARNSIQTTAQSIHSTECYTKVFSSSNAAKESSTLILIRHSKNKYEFNLNATLNPSLADDGFLTRNAVIENSVISVRGDKGIYQSHNKEDVELGVCRIDFSFSKKAVHLKQNGKCWWFGEGIDVSGKYIRNCAQ